MIKGITEFCRKNFCARGINQILPLALIVLTASLPLMTNYILEGENLANSLSRIELISERITEGFPVRIQPLSTAEYGYDAAAFEADVFLLLPGILHRLGMSLQTSYKVYLWIINLAAAVISFVCFQRCFGQKELGLVGSMLFTWCPYRIDSMYVSSQTGEAWAWCFLPILLAGLAGLCRRQPVLRGEKENEESKQIDGPARAWIPLTVSLCLILCSSVTVFLAAVGICLLWLLFMGRQALRKDTLAAVAKTVLATGFLCAWFLLPLFYILYKNPAIAGNLIPADIRAGGVYPASYLMAFFRGGASGNFVENAMVGAKSLGPGFAAAVCAIYYLWGLFTGRFLPQEGRFYGRRLLILAAVLVWFSTNSFPWELLQNRNLAFSLVLAWMQTPAKWGIGACLILILLSCHVLDLERKRGGIYKICIGVTVGTAFFTTQFLTGNILLTADVVKPDPAQGWESLPLQTITQIPVLWRAAEAVSLAALIFLIVMGIVRRRKSVKRV